MGSIDTGLPQGFDSDRLSHAYIVYGGMAAALAMAAVCSGSGIRPCMRCAHCMKASRGIHPDIATIDKPAKKREIIVEQIRELKRDVIVVPNEADKKVYIINNADTMNQSAQNALLRILEEPPSHAMFILQTDVPTGLLPTIRSRCAQLKPVAIGGRAGAVAGAGTVEGISTGKGAMAGAGTGTGAVAAGGAGAEAESIGLAGEFLSAVSRGNASLVRFMFRLEALDREQFAGFLAAVTELTVREMSAMGLSGGDTAAGDIPRDVLSRLERIIKTAGEYLEFNVGVGHISAMICASLINNA